MAPTYVRTITLPSPGLTLKQMRNIVKRRLRSLRLARRHLERCADVLLALARPWLHICEAEAGTEGTARPGWDRYIRPGQGARKSGVWGTSVRVRVEIGGGGGSKKKKKKKRT